METVAADSAMHKKARVGREGFDARAMSPARALRLALGKAADAEMDLVLSVSTVEQQDVVQAGLGAAFGDGGLLLLLEGERGRRGAVRIDMAFLASVIEHLTTGRIASHAAEDRHMTRTDAAMVAPLMDAVFERAEASLAGQAGAEAWHGFRFGAMIEDVHGLALALEADRFHMLRLSVALGDGAARTGMIEFLVPEAPASQAADSATPAGLAAGKAGLGQLALDAPVVLRAMMGRIDLPLDAAMALTAGDILPVSGCAGLKVRLEATEAHLVAEAKLGQMNGQRALRLTSGPDRGIVQDAPTITPPIAPSISQSAEPPGRPVASVAPASRVEGTIEHMADIPTAPVAPPVATDSQAGNPQSAQQARDPVPSGLATLSQSPRLPQQPAPATEPHSDEMPPDMAVRTTTTVG